MTLKILRDTFEKIWSVVFADWMTHTNAQKPYQEQNLHSRGITRLLNNLLNDFSINETYRFFHPLSFCYSISTLVDRYYMLVETNYPNSLQLHWLHFIFFIKSSVQFFFWHIYTCEFCPLFILQMQYLRPHWLLFDKTLWTFQAVPKLHFLTNNWCCNYRSKESDLFAADFVSGGV